MPFALRNCHREWRILLAFSLPAVLGNLIVTPVFWACNALLVNQPGGYVEKGIFDAANQLCMAVLVIPGLAGQAALPILSSLLAQCDWPRYLKVLKYNIVLSGGAAVLVALPLGLFAPWIMRIYGHGFQDGQWVLVCQAFSAILIGISAVVGHSLASRSKMWVGLLFNVLWGIAMVGCSLWLVKLGYGALGLALAYLIAYALHTLWAGLYAYCAIGQYFEGRSLAKPHNSLENAAACQ